MSAEPTHELLPHKIVLRLVSLKDQFIPRGAILPTWEAFNPSSEDKEEARRRGCDPRVSVWDSELTTVEQAQAFRRDTECKPYWLRVEDIHAVGAFAAVRRLRVVADPLPEEKPGAAGHCGIEGLHRKDGESKKDWKTLLDKLAQKCMDTFPK